MDIVKLVLNIILIVMWLYCIKNSIRETKNSIKELDKLKERLRDFDDDMDNWFNDDMDNWFD